MVFEPIASLATLVNRTAPDDAGVDVAAITAAHGTLRCCDMRFGDEGLRTIAASSSVEWAGITAINLTNCNLTFGCLDTISMLLQKAPKTQELRLDGNFAETGVWSKLTGNAPHEGLRPFLDGLCKVVEQHPHVWLFSVDAWLTANHERYQALKKKRTLWQAQRRSKARNANLEESAGDLVRQETRKNFTIMNVQDSLMDAAGSVDRKRTETPGGTVLSLQMAERSERDKLLRQEARLFKEITGMYRPRASMVSNEGGSLFDKKVSRLVELEEEIRGMIGAKEVDGWKRISRKRGL